jgi:L-amino acid N-acyltransferase YncA
MATPTSRVATTTEPLAMAPAIRVWTAADAVACAAIYAPYVERTTVSFEIEPPQASELERRFQGLMAAGYPVLVAEHDARVVGYAYAGMFRARPAYRHTVEHSVYVDPNVQRGGVGRALLVALIESCRQRGFRRMVGVISDPANSRSLDFHRRQGFALVGTLHGIGHKFGRDLDVVMVERALD